MYICIYLHRSLFLLFHLSLSFFPRPTFPPLQKENKRVSNLKFSFRVGVRKNSTLKRRGRFCWVKQRIANRAKRSAKTSGLRCSPLIGQASGPKHSRQGKTRDYAPVPPLAHSPCKHEKAGGDVMERARGVVSIGPPAPIKTQKSNENNTR